MGDRFGDDVPRLHCEDAMDSISEGVVLVNCGWHFWVIDGQYILAVRPVSLRAKRLTSHRKPYSQLASHAMHLPPRQS